MRQRPALLKVFIVILLVASAFTFSGVEAAFCDDGVHNAPAHECFNCQSGHSVTIPNPSFIASPLSPKALSSIDIFLFYPQVPSLDFFRPPIFA